jgi:hypothetical protein
MKSGLIANFRKGKKRIIGKGRRWRLSLEGLRVSRRRRGGVRNCRGSRKTMSSFWLTRVRLG